MPGILASGRLGGVPGSNFNSGERASALASGLSFGDVSKGLGEIFSGGALLWAGGADVAASLLLSGSWFCAVPDPMLITITKSASRSFMLCLGKHLPKNLSVFDS